MAGALGVGVLLGCTDAASTPEPGSGPSESPPPDTTSTPILPTAPTEIGGQTGSGGLPPGFSCAPTQYPGVQMLSDGDCLTSLKAGFSATLTALVQTGSECVAARATDATLDDVPVCRCDYESAHYFSDTGQRTSSSYTVGLARRRSILSQPGDSCELRRDYPAFGSVCLLEGAAFSGCTTDEADNSCEAVCGEVSRKHADLLARSSESVEALAAECLPCASGYCAGVLRAGDRCFFGMQYSLGFGYYPVSIPCDATPEQMLEAQIQANGYLNTCNLQVSEEASCTSSTSAACEDAGVGDAGGEPDIAADAAPGEAR